MGNDPRTGAVVLRLKEQGCRITPQRLAVVDALIGSGAHPTVEQIYGDVQAKFPTISLATVYKIVNLLKDLGEIRELTLQGDRHRYDGRTAEPHPHVICLRCQAVADADIPGWSRFAREAQQRTGFHILEQRLEFFGLCRGCQQKDLPQV